MANTNTITGGTGVSPFKPPKHEDEPLSQYGHEGIRGALIRLGRVQPPPRQSLSQQVIGSQIRGGGGGAAKIGRVGR